jgi:hypothetical protein
MKSIITILSTVSPLALGLHAESICIQLEWLAKASHSSVLQNQFANSP